MLTNEATPLKSTRGIGALLAAGAAAARDSHDFVAGMSHELRTPLTVIRSASFASAKTGSLLGKIAPLSKRIGSVSPWRRSAPHAHPGLIIETHIPPELSKVLAGEIALRHALENLIDNAAKHGANPDQWIGVCAREVEGRGNTFVEIGILDRVQHTEFILHLHAGTGRNAAFRKSRNKG
jgi:signal transduction histidine kinase